MEGRRRLVTMNTCGRVDREEHLPSRLGEEALVRDLDRFATA